jgi:hypothetical protein
MFLQQTFESHQSDTAIHRIADSYMRPGFAGPATPLATQINPHIQSTLLQKKLDIHQVLLVSTHIAGFPHTYENARDVITLC